MTKADFVPIYVKIERFIRDEIASGRLREGDRTPSEPELAKRFGTTRATVARAFQEMVFEGLIVRRSGSGTFVAKQNVSAPMDLMRVWSFEEQLAAQGASIRYELIGFARRVATDVERHRLALTGDRDVYLLERLRIVDDKRMSVEHRIIPGPLGAGLSLEALHTRSVHQMLGMLGFTVAFVEGKIRADKARSADAKHLGIRRGDPLLVRDYVLLDPQRAPLVFGHSIYRSDFAIGYSATQHSPR